MGYLNLLARPWGVQRWRVRVAWLRIRGRTGAFKVVEDSARARRLTAAWENAWPGAAPDGYMSAEDRWVRFHSLPESKRYADSEAEYGEILRRHYAVLDALSGGTAYEQLVVIGVDYGPNDLVTGWTRRYLPGAWPWQCRLDADDPDRGPSYFWVKSEPSQPELDTLLRAVADDYAQIIVIPTDASWVFKPYDGGADIYAADRIDRDALRDRFADWLSKRADGL
ncbi:hypothetical protein ACIA49_18130 [Kribbella sp. NPDC051587]|uniref:DUF3885 domain-containing protein n=1 Tax=Kribbella sp. NPDC051587 TaxID=3364119 RepID=UPI0037BC5E47